MLLSLLTGRLVECIGARDVVADGFVLLVLALVGMAGLDVSMRAVIALSALYVVGFAFAAVAMNDLVVRLGGAVRGSAMAFYVFVAFTGASIGLPLGSLLQGLPFADFVAGLAILSGAAAMVLMAAIRPARQSGTSPQTS